VNVVCPFCPLHCDDLQVGDDGAVNVRCDIAVRSFANAVNPSSARIGDKPATLAEATRFVQNQIQSKPPAVLSGSQPLSVARRLHDMQADGLIDWHLSQTATHRSLRRTISRDGVIAATLADVKRHADCIWSIGNVDRKIIPRIDEWLSPPQGQAVSFIASGGITTRQLGDLLHAIRRGQSPIDPALTPVFDTLSNSRYLAVAWFDDGFDPIEAEASSAILLDLISLLNEPQEDRDRRAVLLSFDPCQTIQNVSLWRENRILGDANELDLAALIAGETIVVRLGQLPGRSDFVSAQLGGEDPGPESAQVYIPVSVEGVHHTDMIVRGDSAVTLPLMATAKSELPSAIDWLESLFSASV
tara:strand:- start:14336 stop:15409 length:1074 start_codon:yes stop_codon:yes gene_type:complete